MEGYKSLKERLIPEIRVDKVLFLFPIARIWFNLVLVQKEIIQRIFLEGSLGIADSIIFTCRIYKSQAKS